MDRGAWQATVHGVAKVRHDLATKSLSPLCPSSQWCHPTISSSIVPFSSCPQSFPASRSSQMSQLFATGGQNIGASASRSVLPNEYSVFISFRIYWFDVLVAQGTLKSLLQHHNLKASVLHPTFFMVQLSHLYMNIGKTVALTMWTFVSNIMCLLFNTLPRFVIAFFLRRKCL